MELEELGFGQWFRKRLDNSLLPEYGVARVIAAQMCRSVIKNKKKRHESFLMKSDIISQWAGVWRGHAWHAILLQNPGSLLPG